MSAFQCCKVFSENFAHVCACLCCANGEAFLRGMRQAAFLKAVGKFLLMWESPALSQANKKTEIGIKCERKVPAHWFSLCWEWEGLEAELAALSWKAGHWWCLGCCRFVIVSQLQGTVSSLPCGNCYAYLMLIFLTHSLIFFLVSARVACCSFAHPVVFTLVFKTQPEESWLCSLVPLLLAHQMLQCREWGLSTLQM